MWQKTLEGIGALFRPVADLVDNVHTSEEERLTLKTKLEALQHDVALAQLDLLARQIELEGKAMEARARVLETEARAESWITRSWRPLAMLTFLALIVLNAFGAITLSDKMAEDFMTLVQIGLGGYILGRSAEKAMPAVASALRREPVPKI